MKRIYLMAVYLFSFYKLQRQFKTFPEGALRRQLTKKLAYKPSRYGLHPAVSLCHFLLAVSLSPEPLCELETLYLTHIALPHLYTLRLGSLVAIADNLVQLL